MPAADFCDAVRVSRLTFSHDSVTRRRSPEVSSTAFSAQPPDLPPAALMEMGFAVSCPLARCRRPIHPVFLHRLAPLLHASFRPRLAATPLRFAIPSPPSGWKEDFHLQAVEHARHTREALGASRGPKIAHIPNTRSRCAMQSHSIELAERILSRVLVPTSHQGASGASHPSRFCLGRRHIIRRSRPFRKSRHPPM